MFAIWAAECVFVPINYKLHPREMQQILDDAGARMVFASPKIARRTGRRSPTCPSRSSARKRTRVDGWRRAGGPRRAHRSRRTGVAVLHQRNHRPVQGRDAVASQPDGDDGRPSRGLRFARRGLQPGARCADVARLGPLHPAVRDARRAAGDTGLRRVRARRVPRPLRAPSGLQRLPRPDDGPAPGADRTAVPAQPAHGGLRRRPDVRREPEEGDGRVRPDLRPALRPGRGADDDHRTAPSRPPAMPTTPILGSVGYARSGVDVAVLRDDGTPGRRSARSARSSAAATL